MIRLEKRKETEDNILKMNDCPLRITMQMLFILINNPGKYSLKALEEKLGYKVQHAIISFLDQDIFGFYSGSTRLTRDNIDEVLKSGPEGKLSIVSRAEITDQHSFKKFYALREDYEKAASEKKNFEGIITYNSYAVVSGNGNADAGKNILQLLSEGKTAEYEFSLRGSRFYPLAVYKSRRYDREYLVALEKQEKGYKMKFYPCEYSQKIGKPSSGHILLSELYPDTSVIRATNEKLRSIWGPHDMDLDEKTFKISAIINDKSCIDKIRHDVSDHICNLIDNKDETYSLVMEVLGYDAFRSWVLSYGSSIEIREPKNLRNDIRKTYEEVRDRYS